MATARREKFYDTARGGSCGRLRRRFAATLGALVLAFNLLAGGIFPSRLDEALASSENDSSSLDRFVVCTSTGMVVIDQDGHRVPSNNTAGHSGVCLLCLPLLHGDTAVPAQVAGIQPPQSSRQIDVAIASEQPSFAARLRGSASPRAPPLS